MIPVGLIRIKRLPYASEIRANLFDLKGESLLSSGVISIFHTLVINAIKVAGIADVDGSEVT